jgi:hypothetical protein
MAQTVDDLCYAHISLRSRRCNSLAPKKRRNKKEVRDRKAAMAKRDSQREAHERQLENDRKHLEELNLQWDSKYLEKQQLKEQILNPKQEKTRLYLEAMIKDLSGSKYHAYYDKRVEEFRSYLLTSPKVRSEYDGRSRLLAAMLQKVSA